jgi:hypothetical protein
MVSMSWSCHVSMVEVAEPGVVRSQYALRLGRSRTDGVLLT